MIAPLVEPQYGKRLLHVLIDDLSMRDPDRPYAAIPRSKDPREGYDAVDFARFAGAIDKCCWFLDESLPDPQDDVFAFIGFGGDLRYQMLCMAAAKTCRTVFFPSSRCSLEAHLAMLESAQCNTFVVPSSTPPIVKEILKHRQMKVVTAPEASDLLNPMEVVPYYEYNRSFEEAKFDQFLILHTSGSTGIPKLIFLNHGYFTSLDILQTVSPKGGAENLSDLVKDRRVFLGFPGFHAAGLIHTLPMTIYFGATFVVPPFDTPLTAELINDINVYGGVHGSFIPASIPGELVANETWYENLSRLDFLGFGGGPAPKAVGDLVAQKTRPFNLFGTTEGGFYYYQLLDPVDWQYYKYLENQGSELRPTVDKDLFELVFVRKPELELFQGIFYTFPELQEWSSKDLYAKHPTQEGLWTFKGRLDDVIVFETGESINPLDFEAEVSTHDIVSSAIVAGQGRYQSSLLVEPAQNILTSTSFNRVKFVDSIWPTIQQANSRYPAYGRVAKDYIIVTSSEKPFLRAGKGTVQRQLTVALYQQELDQLYQTNAEDAAIAAREATPNTPEQILRSILEQNPEYKALHRETDFLRAGLDSVEISNLVRQYNKIAGETTKLTAGLVYAHPTLSKLSQAIEARKPRPEADIANRDDSVSLREVYESLAAEIPITSSSNRKTPKAKVVLLTGATGTLGSHLLETFISDPSTTHVYCLNRSPNNHLSQTSTSAKHEHPTSTKVTVLTGTLSAPNFSLSPSTYRTLLQQTTHIIHAAWAVDFNYSLSAFTPTHLQGLLNLIKVSSNLHHCASFTFISSVAVAHNLHQHSPLAPPSLFVVPERVIKDFTAPASTGYAQSKFISELLLNDAADRIEGTAFKICRVGQITGPITETDIGTAWPKREWLPSLIEASSVMGYLPSSLGAQETITWIPVTYAAEAVGRVALTNDSRPTTSINSEASAQQAPAATKEADPEARVYNIVNPHATTWSNLTPSILNSHVTADLNPHHSPGSASPMKLIPLHEWIDRLESAVNDTTTTIKNPNTQIQNLSASKLLPFYRSLLTDPTAPHFDTRKIEETCPEVVAGMGPVRAEWMRVWMRDWGFLSTYETEAGGGWVWR